MEKAVVALEYTECADLLRQQKVGRIAAGLDGWPAILPVNYVFVDPDIVVRTGEGLLIDEAPMTEVAFEVDDWDRDGAWGWSVLVQGPAFDITDTNDETSLRLRASGVTPFAPGEKARWLRIVAVRVSGRRFGEPS
jgi:nitroimidazol reductase NimA-like FMN-containing flavoprotein (pyridoxamine 5'-phosphate oxidase superfamily)